MLSALLESGKMKDKEKDTVVVYYSTGTGTGTSDFLYPLPKQLFSELIKIRSKKKNLSPFFQCPAMSESMKSTYFFDSPFDLTYPYDFKDGILVPKDTIVDQEGFQKIEQYYRGKLNHVNAAIQGAYGSMDKGEYSRYTLGRIIGNMKGWVAYQGMRRFK